MTVWDLYQVINTIAPYSLASDWDRSGLQTGYFNNQVTKVLIALDFTETILDEAIQMGAELIVTHHPYLFQSPLYITDQTTKGRLLLRLAEEKIALLAAHTNLDVAHGGINDILCRLLELENVKIHQAAGESTLLTDSYRIGILKQECLLEEFLKKTKELLQLSHIRYTGPLQKVVKIIAVCSGGGSEFLLPAARAGADVLLTADCKYHDYQAASEEGIILADAGHFETENIVCPYLKKSLETKFPDLTIKISDMHHGFYHVL